MNIRHLLENKSICFFVYESLKVVIILANIVIIMLCDYKYVLYNINII